MLEIHWGLPVIIYLFLGGLGAGAGVVSASVFLRSHAGDASEGAFDIARWGALIAPIPVIAGTGALVFELGSFAVGDMFRWINLFLTINLSPMSLGSWFLALFIGVSLCYAYTFLKSDAHSGDKHQAFRKMLAWVMVPLGIGVALYTGILLGAMPARPFWNSPILAMLFLISALSTGVASILLVRCVAHALGHKKADEYTGEGAQGTEESKYILAATDMLLISFEVLVVFLFIMYAHLTIGGVENAIDVILGGSLTSLFWFGFVVIGLIIPILIEMKYVLPRLLRQEHYSIPHAVELAACMLVIVGGFMLRYVVVIAGQLTGPVGI